METLGLEAKGGTMFGKLSGGQQQRLSIALALLGSPRVAVLDELTTGLDPQARRGTWELIENVRERGVTIVLVTHFMEEAERLCDRVALIDAGRVVVIDSPAALAERATAGTADSVPSVGPLRRPAAHQPSGCQPCHAQGRCRGCHGHRERAERGDLRLARHQITAQRLRVDQGSLEDAFLKLTGPAKQDEE